jgi:hypothetical protein
MCTPPGGMTGSQAEGRNRLTPASLAAVASGICCNCSSAPDMHEMRMSTPLREETRVSCGEVIENGRMVSPREEKAVFAALETDVGRVSEMIFCGGMAGSLARRPSTMERPVWPVAPRIAIVGAMVRELGRQVLCGA